MASRLVLFILTATAVVFNASKAHAQIPHIVSYQGRVTVDATNFDGVGQFRFAFVNGTGTTTFWSNSPDTTPADGVPDAPVSVNVTKGLYSVLLGDTTLGNMAGIPPAVFNNADVRLRVWFDDGARGVQHLVPDQRIAAVGYAIIAGNVSDGVVTNAKLANMPPGTFKARIADVVGSPEDATPAQVAALLPTATPASKGLVPPLTGNSAEYLNGTGAWSAPVSGGAGGHVAQYANLLGGDVVVRYSAPLGTAGFSAVFSSVTGGIGDTTGSTDRCTLTVPAGAIVESVVCRKASPIGRMQLVLPIPNGANTTATAPRPIAMRLEADGMTTSSASRISVSGVDLILEVSGLSGASGGITVHF